jgi:uncharacterized protein YggE
MNSSKVAVLALSIWLGTAAGRSEAQYYNPFGAVGGDSSGNIEGFSVVGKASVGVKPNLLEIDLEVNASSELSADAIVKYRDAKRKLSEAFAGLKMANVTVEERGLLVDQKGMMNQNYFFNGMPPSARAKTEVQLSRKLIVKATDIRAMDEGTLLQLIAKLLDVAQDAGGKIGQANNFNPYRYNPYQMNGQSLVRFVVDDLDALQDEAFRKAMHDAQGRAERLATISKVTLGPVLAVREQSIPGDRPRNGMPEEEEIQPKRLESTKFQEIPVRVELLVRFGIRPATAKADAEAKPAGAAAR